MTSIKQETIAASVETDLSSLVQPSTSAEVEIQFPHLTQLMLAWQDFKEGIQKWPIWLMLAYGDIKLRYRRSILGPFWLTLSMGITVYAMGFLYAHLFHINLQQYYPLLVAGMLTWELISIALTELTDTFMLSNNLIKQIKLPYTLYVHRVITRNVLIFFHNILVMIPIYLLFPQGAKLNLHSFLLIPSLALVYLNATIYGLILAILGARYRDISQIVKSLIRVIFFVTPIMWTPLTLPSRDRFLVDLNPFYSFVELIRAPLLGVSPTSFNLMMVLIVTLLGSIIAIKMFTRYRARIIYWL